MSYSLKEDLEGRLLRFIENDGSGGGGFRETKLLADAHGMDFLCPKCFKAKGAEGSHSITLWFSKLGERSVKLQGHPGWNPEGVDLSDITFVPPGAISVLLKLGCKWHGFIRDGRATLS